MTGDALGPLGRRFLVAFVAVALAAVVLVTAAGLVGSERGLSRQGDSERQAVADRVAAAAGDAYASADGWQGAPLDRAESLAQGGGATLVVLDPAGERVWPQGGARRGHHAEMGEPDGDMGAGMGNGMAGTGMGAMAQRVSTDVVVADEVVGQVELGFPTSASGSGRPVAWTWILVAAGGALLLALVAAWFVSRRLTGPVAALTRAARSFARGERETVVKERGVGELAELADAFEEAVAAVHRAEGSRSRMAADVAHELRTPLAALQAGLEELRDGLAPADPERLGRLHDQALRVGRIVGDLDALFAAEGTSREIRHDPVDLAALAHQEVEARGALLRAADLEVALETPSDEPVWARGDQERLHQVLGNLLENCVRHCRPGDSVHVRVERGDPDGQVRLVVADTGPGLSPDDLPHVFERFWRGARQSGRPGSGLGLAVVRSLVEAQHGSVTVASDGVTGTTFTVSLPRAAATLPA